MKYAAGRKKVSTIFALSFVCYSRVVVGALAEQAVGPLVFLFSNYVVFALHLAYSSECCGLELRVILQTTRSEMQLSPRQVLFPIGRNKFLTRSPRVLLFMAPVKVVLASLV